MKNTNNSRKRKAEALVSNIIENKNMIDIHRFMDKKIWKDLGMGSLSACIDENIKLPSETTMRRVFKAVEFQLAYLPEIEIGEINKFTLLPISEGDHSKHIKRSVAQKILNSVKSPNEITKNDVLGFIASSQLNEHDKKKATEFAQILVTDDLLDEISDYVDMAEMDDLHCEAFLRRIGLKVKTILMKNMGV